MKHVTARLLHLMTGLVFYAFGIVITINANIGYAPWDVFHVGLAKTTGLSIGTASIIVGIIIGVIAIILGEKLGAGTISNMILIGVAIDIIFPHIPLAKNPVIGIIMLFIGVFIISFDEFR